MRPCCSGGTLKATGDRPPSQAFADVSSKLAYERLEIERFVFRYAITDFRMNPHFPVNTLALMRGAIAARRLDLFAPYVEWGFRDVGVASQVG